MGEHAPPEEVLRGIATDKGMPKRFRENVTEFYSHPGAFQALQQSLGMFGQQAPDVYGADWESAMRSRLSQGVGMETEQMGHQVQQGMAGRGMFGAMDQTAQTQVGQAGAMARLQSMLGLRGMLADKRYEMFQDQFGRDYQATGLLSGLVGGQPAYPVQMQGPKMSSFEKVMMGVQGVGNLAKGIGSVMQGSK